MAAKMAAGKLTKLGKIATKKCMDNYYLELPRSQSK